MMSSHYNTFSCIWSHNNLPDRHVKLKIWNASSLCGEFVTEQTTGVHVLVPINAYPSKLYHSEQFTRTRTTLNYLQQIPFNLVGTFLSFLLSFLMSFHFAPLHLFILLYYRILFFSYQLPSLSTVISPHEFANRRATFISSVLSHTSFSPHSFISLLFLCIYFLRFFFIFNLLNPLYQPSYLPSFFTISVDN